MNDEEKRLRKNEYQRNLRANKIKPQKNLKKLKNLSLKIVPLSLTLVSSELSIFV